MKKQIFLFVVACLFLFHAKSSLAVGSGAFNLELMDSEATSKGNAFIGEADNPSAVYYNPAGLVQLEQGRHVSFGSSFVALRQKFEDETQGKFDSHNENFIIPHFFLANKFANDKFAIGAGAGSRWGLGTNWEQDSFARYSSVKYELFNSTYMLTGAYRVTDNLSFGAGVDYQMDKANKSKKVIQSGAGDDADLQMKGKDNGSVGGHFSGLYKFNEANQVGLTYRLPVQVRYKGELMLSGLNNLGVFPYQAIFGGTSFSTPVEIKLNLPQSLALGYSFKPTGKWRFNLDLEWMDWSSVEEEETVFHDTLTPLQSQILNNGNPNSLDYNDTISVGVGAEYQWNTKLALRSGYFFHQTPVQEVNLEACLPDSNSHNFTLGVGYKLFENFSVDVTNVAMFFERRNVDTSKSTSYSDISGKYSTFAEFGMVTATLKF